MAESKKYRGRLEDRIVSYASAIAEELQENETMGLAAQSVSKAALNLASAAMALKDTCLVAAEAPSNDPISGQQRRRIEQVYTGLAQQIEETFETELSQPLELLVVVGIALAPDPEQARGLEDWARGLGICTDGLAPSEEEVEEAQAELVRQVVSPARKAAKDTRRGV